MTGEEWDVHYWLIRSDLKRSLVYEGDEETQREIALRETAEQFGPRPEETT